MARHGAARQGMAGQGKAGQGAAWHGKDLMFGDSMKGEVIIKLPKFVGNGACIYVPRRWVGWIVKAEVVGKSRKKKEE